MRRVGACKAPYCLGVGDYHMELRLRPHASQRRHHWPSSKLLASVTSRLPCVLSVLTPRTTRAQLQRAKIAAQSDCRFPGIRDCNVFEFVLAGRSLIICSRSLI